MKNFKAQEIPNGRWKKAEHDKFMKGLEKYGRDWLKVQKFVKTRSLAQVRSHAQKCFKNMSQQDIEAYFSEEKEYTCTSFGRIKMNREKIIEAEKPIKIVSNEEKILIRPKQTESLLQMFKKALDYQESSILEKIDERNFHCHETNCGRTIDFEAQEKGSLLPNTPETQFLGNLHQNKKNGDEEVAETIPLIRLTSF